MKLKLDKIPDDALEAELERRKRIVNEPPKPSANPDFSELTRTVIEGLGESVKNGYMDDDLKHYIYEAAMEAVYGKKFWEWNNKKKW